MVNLRGVKESGRAFAVPTYGFVAIVLLLLAVAGMRLALGQTLTAESAGYGLVADHRTGGLLTVFLALRAFASGCTALTGVEAVSNGVPSFQPAQGPQRRHHADDHGRAGRSSCSPASPRWPWSRTCTWPRTRSCWSACPPGRSSGPR